MTTLYSHRVPALVSLLTLGLLAGCLKQESGIDNRHILGLALIPPLEIVEIETGDESSNDTVETAEDCQDIGYRMTVVDGVLSSVEYVIMGGGSYEGDFDTYKFISGVEGDISVDLSWEGNRNYDMFQLDILGEAVQSANASGGFEHIDITVEEEEEIYISVVGRDQEDGADGAYRLVVTGLAPIDAGEMLLGAYPNSDASNLGDPVSGTSIQEWSLDEVNYRYWATFDMYIVQQVQAVENVFIDSSLEDGLDNNCDGTTDRGDTDVDADEDGVSILNGDCDDTDPTVRPNRPDDFGDYIDGDCDGWADNGPDGSDQDGDGMTAFDGDCNDADPLIYGTLQTEAEMAEEPGMEGVDADGKDNNCDGTVDSDIADQDDSPYDNDEDGWTIDDGDCNDADPTIHPCDEEEKCYDYRDAKDNDCDILTGDMTNFKMDENFELVCESGDSSPLEIDRMVFDDHYTEDHDGDGFSIDKGDCNDDNDFVFPGNYELETYYDINSDIDLVYIFGGTFSSLNNTVTGSGDFAMSEPMAVDLSDMPENTSWDMDEDWLANGGTLVPDGMIEVNIDIMKPPLFGISFTDEEPNDCDLSGNPGTWDECAQVLDGCISAGGAVDRINGTFETIEAAWPPAGDNDTYYIVVNEAGRMNAELDWETEGADMDLQVYCYFGDEYNPYGWYSFMLDTADTTKPEVGASYDWIVIPVGTECYAWAAGYEGPAGEPYTLKLWMTPAESE